MGAAELWEAVVANYDEDGLVALTNIRDRSATDINDTVGESAAQEVIDLWPAYAQEVYDDENSQHVAVGRHAVIAVLWHRGGASTQIAKVEWEAVFADDGMLGRIRKTGARSRQGPATNSGVLTQPEERNGRPVQGWSDRGSLPHGLLPSDRLSRP